MKIDMSGVDLHNHNPDMLRKIKWRFKPNHSDDNLISMLGEYWYNKLNVPELKRVIVGKKFYRTDEVIEEWGIAYNVFIEHNSDFPVLLVCYNRFGGGQGARIIEWMEGRFENDINLKDFLLF